MMTDDMNMSTGMMVGMGLFCLLILLILLFLVLGIAALIKYLRAR